MAENKCEKKDFSRRQGALSRHSFGMYILHCMEHQVPVYAHVMPISEGNKDSVSSVCCAFARMPDVVCTDVACQDAQYQDLRCPLLQQDSLRKLDRCHGMGHKCSLCFKLFDCGHDGIEPDNDNIAEQFNQEFRYAHIWITVGFVFVCDSLSDTSNWIWLNRYVYSL